MAAKKKSGAFDFVVDRLKKKPKSSYQEIAAAATKKGLKIYPILYGRAQALLGIVKSKPRGKGKAKKKAAKRRGPGRPPKRALKRARRGPGRPRKKISPLESLDVLISGLKDVQKERDQLQNALEKIRDIIDRVV